MKNHFRIIFGHGRTPRHLTRGQVLLEVLIALAAVATISATIATLIIVAQRGQESAKRRDAAANIAAEVFAAITSMANSDIPNVTQGYNRIYCPPDGVCRDGGYPETTGKDPGGDPLLNRYHPVLVGNQFELAYEEVTQELAGFDFTNYVTIENVCRDSGLDGTVNGTWVTDLDECPNGILVDVDDPFTQKITATFTAPDIEDIVFAKFITRSRSNIVTQSSWSGAVVADTVGDGVIEFSIYWGNDDNDDTIETDPVKIFLCKSELQPLNLECPSGSWTQTPSFTTTSPAILYYSPIPVDVGDNNYWVYVCDAIGQCSFDSFTYTGDPMTWPNWGSFTVN